MNNPINQPSSLLDLDLFDLLKLSHLSDEEKQSQTKKIEEIVYSSIVTEDLPKLLSKEDFEGFLNLAEKGTESADFLRAKIPDYDKLVLFKFLALKKELVRDNMLERLDIVKQEREELRSGRNHETRLKRLVDIEKEQTLLGKILGIIESDQWDEIMPLINQLP